MRHFILLLFLIATCKMVCLAQRSDLTRLPADLDNFRDSITKYHADPFRHISRGQFRTTIDSLKRLSPKLSPEALYVGLLELASEMEDEHFSFAHKQRPFLFGAHWFKEGFYLIAADEPDMIFSKIIGVEQYSVDSVLQGFKRMIPTENKSLFKKQAAAYLSNPVILYGMGIIGNRDSVHLVLEKGNGDTVTRKFTVQSDGVNLNVFAARKEMMRFDNRGNYWYDILMPQRVLYLNYSRCVEDPNRPFSAMYWEMIPKIKKYFNDDLKGKHFALWGLAFKPNTDDIREAPALYIVDELLAAGATVSAFDPEAMKNVQQVLGNRIHFASNQYEALKGADALIIATEWNEFRTPDFLKIVTSLKNKTIFDGRNLFDVNAIAELGFHYESVGRRPVSPNTNHKN